MKDESFEEYLAERLSKPTGDWCDPDGNSTRATVVRMRNDGYLAALKWEFFSLVGDIKYFLTKDFKGIETPIVWFVQFLFIPVICPVVLFTRTSSRYKEAIAEYRRDYDAKAKASKKQQEMYGDER